MSSANTAEPIEMPFGMWILVPRKHVLDRSTHWHNLANTIEPFICGKDAAFLPRDAGLGSCNSVRLSHACFVTNPKNLPAIFFIPYERAILLVF